MMHLRYLVPFVLALSTISCQAEPEPGDPYTTSLVTVDGALMQFSPTAFLIVADDADTMEAAQLRAKLTQSLRQGLLHEIDERWGSCGSRDPAQWHPADIRIVVARPSAPDGESLLTPLDIPNLAWITQTSKEQEIDAVISAATEALGKRFAQAGEVYRPLHATKRAVNLLLGARSPENTAESAFVATLPKTFSLQVIVANTRMDEDPVPTGQLLPAQSTNDIYIAGYSVIGPSSTGDATCNVYPLGTSRLENWSAQVSGSFVAWPCDYQNTWDLLMYGGWVDCGPTCHSRPLRVAPNGSVECRIFVDQPDLDKCDPDHGWKDPDGKATFADRYGKKVRRCEIVQYTGAKLDACQHSLDCTDCGSGFCVTEVPELVTPQSYCSGSDVPWSLRFTGGAIAADNGWLRIMCETGEK